MIFPPGGVNFAAFEIMFTMTSSMRHASNTALPARDEESHASSIPRFSARCLCEEVTEAARGLLAALETNAPARDRALEAEKARARARERFA